MNGLPYYKAYPRDFFEGTIGMPLEMKGPYRLILDMIYMQGGALPDDARYISGLLGCSVRAWNKVRDYLISERKIEVRGAFLGNFAADKQLETLGKFQDKQRENRARPNKNKDLESPRSNHTEPDTDIEKEATSVASQKCALSFSDFWASWPNKTAKAQAEKAWKKLNPADREAAASSAGAWFADWRRKHPDASPIHPASYLNQRRWEDEGPKQPVQASRFDAAASNIRSGKPYLCGNISATLARELISQGLVTEAQCREARVI